MSQFEELMAGKILLSKAADSALGTLNVAVTSGKLKVEHEQSGLIVKSTFTLTAARIPVTDGAASGSYGTLKLFTFPKQVNQYLSCAQKYTAFAEGSALTTGAGDAAFVMGVGSAAVAAAADGTLSTTSVDIGAITATMTNSGGTTTGSKYAASTAVIDGTSTAPTLNLNWSGTAATIDATSTIDVTGVVVVTWMQLFKA